MKTTFKVSYYLRSNYENKEGKSPVMLRIYLGGEMANLGSADFSGWWQWIIMNKVVPLPYGTDQATTCHPSGCAYRQLRCCKL